MYMVAATFSLMTTTPIVARKGMDAVTGKCLTRQSNKNAKNIRINKSKLVFLHVILGLVRHKKAQ